MRLLSLILQILHYTSRTVAVCQDTLERCSGKICIHSDYDRLILPLRNLTNNVEIGIYDLKILKIDDNKGIIKTSFWFIIRWNEPRLIAPSNISEEFIKLEKSFYELLWLPDIMILDLQNMNFRHFLNKDMEVLYLPDNILQLQTNMLLKSYCVMHFENYPMDNHICPIYFRSYVHNISAVNLSMAALDTRKGIKLNDYSFDFKSVHRLHFGNHSEPGIDIKLQRNIFKYVINYYIPSGLLVSISWVKFV